MPKLAPVTGQWAKQTVELAEKKYHSPIAPLCIWQDRVSKNDRRCQLTDGEIGRVLGKKRDCSGNLIKRGKVNPRAEVERLMNSLPMEARSRITPRQKWEYVGLAESGQLCQVKQQLGL